MLQWTWAILVQLFRTYSAKQTYYVEWSRVGLCTQMISVRRFFIIQISIHHIHRQVLSSLTTNLYKVSTLFPRTLQMTEPPNNYITQACPKDQSTCV